jgi:hypothetical protein
MSDNGKKFNPDSTLFSLISVPLSGSVWYRSSLTSVPTSDNYCTSVRDPCTGHVVGSLVSLGIQGLNIILSNTIVQEKRGGESESLTGVTSNDDICLPSLYYRACLPSSPCSASPWPAGNKTAESLIGPRGGNFTSLVISRHQCQKNE